VFAAEMSLKRGLDAEGGDHGDEAKRGVGAKRFQDGF
jgi:hypothetical protein